MIFSNLPFVLFTVTPMKIIVETREIKANEFDHEEAERKNRSLSNAGFNYQNFALKDMSAMEPLDLEVFITVFYQDNLIKWAFKSPADLRDEVKEQVRTRL